jgi:phosphoglycolate phosphatase-like HAD superfamily hydrolase
MTQPVDESSASPGAVLDGIELVVFDKDGTLIDFDTMWTDWSASLVKDVAAATDPALADPLADALGLDPRTSRIIPGSPMSGTPMGHLRELTMDTLRRHGFSQVVVETVVSEAWRPPDPVALAHPLADLGTLFETLHARGIRVAVATSDDRGPTEATIAGLDLAALVDGIVCADDGLPIKPAPDALLHLCGLLGVAPARTAIVGDSPADLQMGRAAGAGLVVGVLSGVGVREELAPYADVILQSIAELLPQ